MQGAARSVPHLVLEGSAPWRPLGSSELCRIATVLVGVAIGASGEAVGAGRCKSLLGVVFGSEGHFGFQ